MIRKSTGVGSRGLFSVVMVATLAACGGGGEDDGGEGAEAPAAVSAASVASAESVAPEPEVMALEQTKKVSITTAPTVIINEVMAANFHGDSDDDSERSDWVELYNPTAAAINLGGYGLSNKRGSPFRWVFPATVNIAPKGYVRVWLSKKDRVTSTSNLHANFNLDNGADEMVLSAPNGTQLGQTLDSVTLPMTRADVSYCRMPSGLPGAAFAFCEAPTARAANAGASALTMLDKPVIDIASGIYASARTVTVTGPAGAQLRYTLDGSEPKASSALYGAPIAIASSKVLRVAAFQGGVAASLAETATYVIDASNRFAGQRVLFINMAPGDMSAYKGGSRTTSGWSAQAEMLEADASVAFRGNMEAADSGQNGSRSGQDTLPMDIKFSDALGTKNVTYPIFPTKLGTTSFKKLKLRNSGDDYWYAHMRDQYWQSLLDEKVAPGAAFTPVQVFANGQYYGMMDLREKEDESLIENTYGVDKSSVDYINMTKVLSGTNAWANYTAMRDFVAGNNMATPANYAQAKNLLDVENFAQDFALHMFAADRDWLWRNMHFFRMPAYDGKWRFRPHDFDISSGGKNKWGFSTEVSKDMNDYYGDHEGGRMMDDLLASPEFRALYINVIADQLNSTLSVGALNKRLDYVVAQMQPYMAAHFAANSGAGSSSKWTQSVGELRDFINNRATYYDKHTQTKFGLGPRQSVRLSVNDAAMGSVKINTLDLSGSITTANPVWTGAYYPQVPVSLEARPRPGHVFVGWQGASTATQPNINASINADGVAYTALFAKASSTAAPVLNAVAAQNNLTGDTVALRVLASDATGAKLVYSAKKLPAGLSIHPDTGMIYGQPTKSGVYATTVTVSNGSASHTTSINWTVANRGDRMVILPTVVVGDGLGLDASYFNNATLAGVPGLQRVEAPTVEQGTGARPAPGFATSKWSVRWQGYVEAPTAGTYGMQALLNSDDGVRVYVDGNLVIDNWSQPSTAAKQLGRVELRAGVKTPIRIEYWDAAGAAKLQMSWKLPGDTAYSPMTQGVFSTAP